MPTAISELIELIEASTGALFHLTDRRNVPSILQHGLLSKKGLEEGCHSVTYPGGSELTFSLDHDYGLWDYVFASFKWGGLMPKHRNQNQRHPVIIAIDPEILRFDGVKIALGRANHRGTKVRGVRRAIDEMPQKLFGDYMHGRHDWENKDDAPLLRRISDYEILIPRGLSPSSFVILDETSSP